MTPHNPYAQSYWPDDAAANGAAGYPAYPQGPQGPLSDNDEIRRLAQMDPRIKPIIAPDAAPPPFRDPRIYPNAPPPREAYHQPMGPAPQHPYLPMGQTPPPPQAPPGPSAVGTVFLGLLSVAVLGTAGYYLWKKSSPSKPGAAARANPEPEPDEPDEYEDDDFDDEDDSDAEAA